MDPQNACTPPHHILGYTIRSRTRIYVSFIIPSVLELLVYIAQITSDCAVSFQHFRSRQSDFGWATFTLILIPPFLSFIIVLSSKAQWEQPIRDGTRLKFVGTQLMHMVFFPFFVIYRFSTSIFWSIEALFHDDNDEERMKCLEKAEESSTFELYRLIQAYGQSAPQIILQMYHMLTQDLFRNFRTTNAQALSLAFSAIDLASITTTYQRFESQKQVGRHYPWSTPKQKQQKQQLIAKNRLLQEECLRKKRQSERSLTKFPESDKIMENFNKHLSNRPQNNHESELSAQNEQLNADSVEDISEPLTHTVQVHGFDELDNEAGVVEQPGETTTLLTTSTDYNRTDDDKLKTSPSFHLKPIRYRSSDTPTIIEECNEVPNSPAPLPPKTARCNLEAADGPQLRTQTSTQSSNEPNKRRSRTFSQLETFKDMLVMNAQLYIKENVPRPPKILTRRVDEANMKATSGSPPQSPKTPKDVVDFFLPRPTKVVNGIHQEDFAAKSIAFFGWISFVTMRMLSLSTFCVFFPKAFLIIVGVHYLIMLAALFLESRFKGTLNRTLFYFLLAYVYIYVLLEFRIRFKHIRVWFVGYFLLTMAENLTMTMIWYAREEFESWWFGFIFEGIIYSGILFVATILVYYCILKPKDVLLLVEDNELSPRREEQNTNTNELPHGN
uniref:XK-related protein n=1 Tax=Stomoxys calcitrans TaxID=35570 RepID=A0A1I8PZN5_STOCA